jgi:hypothetical protein
MLVLYEQTDRYGCKGDNANRRDRMQQCRSPPPTAFTATLLIGFVGMGSRLSERRASEGDTESATTTGLAS